MVLQGDAWPCIKTPPGTPNKPGSCSWSFSSATISRGTPNPKALKCAGFCCHRPLRGRSSALRSTHVWARRLLPSSEARRERNSLRVLGQVRGPTAGVLVLPQRTETPHSSQRPPADRSLLRGQSRRRGCGWRRTTRPQARRTASEDTGGTLSSRRGRPRRVGGTPLCQQPHSPACQSGGETAAGPPLPAEPCPCPDPGRLPALP